MHSDKANLIKLKNKDELNNIKRRRMTSNSTRCYYFDSSRGKYLGHNKAYKVQIFSGNVAIHSEMFVTTHQECSKRDIKRNL